MEYAFTQKKPSILIVGDKGEEISNFASFLYKEGFSVDMVETGIEALEILDKLSYDVLITEISLPGESALSMIEKIQSKGLELTIIVIVSSSEIDNAIEAMRMGAYDYISIPINFEKALFTIRRAVDESTMRAETPVIENPEAFYEYANLVNLEESPEAIANYTVELISKEVHTENICIFIKSKSFDIDKRKCSDRNKICNGINLDRVLEEMGSKNFISVFRPEIKKIINSQEPVEEAMFFSIKGQKEPIGILTICRNQNMRPLSEGKIKICSIISALSGTAIENSIVHKELTSAFYQTIQSLIQTLEAKDPYTRGHSERVAKYGKILAEEIGLPENECERIYLAGLLHDIGKMGIKIESLNKKGPLSEEETKIFRTHTEVGKKIVTPVRLLHQFIPIIYYHHEKWDGSGYPEGLKGEEIPLGARIIAIADAYDAMASDRPYRDYLPRETIINEFKKNAKKQFDPEIIQVFIKLLEEGKI